MPFINEVISDEEAAQINWEQMTGWVPHKAYRKRPERWCIDRDWNAFFWLICSQNPVTPTDIFGLSWNGEFYIIKATHTFYDYPDNRYKEAKGDLSWLVVQIDSISVEQLENIKKLIDDAFESYGYLYDRKFVGSIKVTFGQQNL